MIPYILYLIISLAIIFFAQRNKKNKTIFAILLLLLLTFCSTFIGIRSMDVGFDTKKYVYPIHHNLSTGMSPNEALKHTSTEVGFTYMINAIVSLSPDFNFCLIVLALLGGLGFIVFTYILREKIEPKYSLLCYVGLYSIYEFNTVRQCITVSLAMMLIAILLKSKSSKLTKIIIIIATTCLGTLIHKTMLLMPLIIALYIFVNSNKIHKKTKIVAISSVTFATLAFSLNSVGIISWLGQQGVIDQKYASYASEDSIEYHETIKFEIQLLVLKMVLIAITLLCLNTKKRTKEQKIIFLFLILDAIFFVVSFHLRNTYRLMWYTFFPTAIYTLSEGAKIIKKGNSSIVIYDTFACALALGFFIAEIAYHDTYGLLPYEIGL